MPRPRSLPTNEIVTRYQGGASCGVLARDLGCTIPGILRVLRREHIPIRPRGGWHPRVFAEARKAQEAAAGPQDILTRHMAHETLQVFVVDQDRHDVDSRMAMDPGLTHARAVKALQDHQRAQSVPSIYLWKDELASPGLSRMLEHRALLDTSPRVHARSCEIREVERDEARAFYDAWHLQGSVGATRLTLGLWNQGYVAMMSFNDPRACRGVQVPWMLQRYASVGRVPGAASRLLSAFRRVHAGELVSYSDNRYSPDGRLYRVLGFDLLREEKPDYRYWRDNRWYAKSAKQRKDLIRELGGCTPEDTEFSMARRAGYKRCYDCGKRTWILH